MNSKKYSIIIIILFLMTNVSAHNKSMSPKIHKLIKQYNFIQGLPSTVMSSFIGIVTGGLSRYIEKEVEKRIVSEDLVIIVVKVIIWWLENHARHSCIETLQHNCDEFGIPYKKNVRNFSAWISSWTSYLYLATDENKNKLYTYLGLSG